MADSFGRRGTDLQHCSDGGKKRTPAVMHYHSIRHAIRQSTANSRTAAPTFLSLNEITASRSIEVRRFLDSLNLGVDSKKTFENAAGQNAKAEGGSSNQKKSSKRSFQRLRKEERRRSMSFNPYRIPKRLRLPVVKDMIIHPPKDSRRVRKDRRRPRYLKELFCNRSDSNRWIETHLWHAKRYHMENAWGHRLAVSPFERCQRKLYRHALRRCVLHDRSYMQMIELSGPLNALKLFLPLCVVDAKHVMKSEYIRGSACGQATLYRPSTTLRSGAGERAVAQELLCPIEFLWKKKESTGVEDAFNEECELNDKRTLWMHVHPSVFEEVLELFETISSYLKDVFEAQDFSVKKVNDLISFELYGPQSLLYLSYVIKLANPASASSTMWNTLIRQSQFGHHQLPHGSVLALDVRVPQLIGPFPPSFRPKAFTPSSTVAETPAPLDTLSNWPLEYCSPSLFCESTRERSRTVEPHRMTVRSRKRRNIKSLVKRFTEESNIHFGKAVMKTSSSDPAVLNKFMVGMKQLNEGEELGEPVDVCEEAATESDAKVKEPKEVANYVLQHSVPVILIFRRKGKRDLCSGVTLLMPSNSGGERLWNLLARYGCLALGIRDRRKLLLEAGLFDFPQDYPETKAAEACVAAAAQVSMQQYQKRPPSKRVNYALYGISCPFAATFQCVFHPPLSSNEPLAVLRLSLYNVIQLDSLSWKFLKAIQSILEDIETTRVETLLRDLEIYWRGWLLPVEVTPISKGVPKALCHLFMPTIQDAHPVSAVVNGGNKHGRLQNQTTTSRVEEPLHTKYRQKHVKRLTCTAGDHNVYTPTFHDWHGVTTFDNPLLTNEERKKNQRSRLPDGALLRPLIGLVVAGNNSLLRGHGFGLAYVSIPSFLSLTYQQRNSLTRGTGRRDQMALQKLGKLRLMLWTRNTTERIYTPAWISPLIEDTR